MTQEELAVRVGVNRATIGNWESGKHYPKRYLGKLEDVLGIELEPDAPVISPELRAMVEALGPEERAWVMGELAGADRRLRRPGEDPGDDDAQPPRRQKAG